MSETTDPERPADSIPRSKLLDYLDQLLDASEMADYCPNGLQVEGRETVRHVVTGVSACRELFARARQLDADVVLVHHGIFWRGSSSRLTGYQYHRVADLVHARLNLVAYHLPLDRHPELGNNALAAQAFGLEERSPFGLHEGVAIGCQGRFPAPISDQDLIDRCRVIFGQEPLAFLEGPARISSLGIVSGAAESSLHEAISGGLDAFVTGESSEWVMNVCREAGIHFLAAGHYATERLGVRALGEHLAERFGIEATFVDVANPV